MQNEENVFNVTFEKLEKDVFVQDLMYCEGPIITQAQNSEKKKRKFKRKKGKKKNKKHDDNTRIEDDI